MVDGEQVKEFLVEGFQPFEVDLGHGHLNLSPKTGP